MKTSKILNRLNINIKNGYIFIRVPKTASQSLNSLLKIKWDHFNANFCRDYLGEDKWNSLYTFGFVRSPWTRLISWYTYHLKKENLYKNYGKTGFNNWIYDGCPHHYDKKFKDKIIFPENPLLQKNWLCDLNGDIIVDYVGKYESMENDMKNICKKIDVPYRELFVVNKSEKINFNLKYTKKSIKIVNDLFDDDFRMFNYQRTP